ncbi:MAG: hypothetical protein Q4G63_09995 [Bacteroidia bacterium]|nr:hypothetical protein [Bacteroidia bacterium]
MKREIFDQDIDIKNLKDKTTLTDCFGKLHFEGAGDRTIYIKGKSNLFVKATKGAKVYLELFDDAQVRIDRDSDSRVYAIKDTPRIL